MKQSQALSILKTGANVFLTGEPGSGKTHTINEYVAYLRLLRIEPAITASTGIAATHIGGITIHSWSGIGIKTNLDRHDLGKIASNKPIVKRVQRAKVLIIDEVSMLPPKTLSMVDAVCREIKQSSEPFGGIQIVLVGDFFQLPPVIKMVSVSASGFRSYLQPLPGGRNHSPEVTEAENNRPAALIDEGCFAYDSPAWERAKPIVCYLTEQHRQDDSDFLSLLSAIRRNAFGNDQLCQIETRKFERHAIPGGAPKLFSHNADVDRVNDEILAKLPGESRVFTMSSQGPDPLAAALKKGCLSPERLSLKIGAAVMFTKNHPKEGFVNGTLGRVEGFDRHDGNPIVKTRSGRRIEVEPMEWAVEENGKIRAQITQWPLRLAWAITVHKSQGMSLDEAVIDLSAVFEFGQGYVALSRVRRLSGLYLLGWNKRAFQVHSEVLEKDATFRARSEQAAQIFGKMTGEEIAAIQKRFVHSCEGKSISENHIGIRKKPHAPQTDRKDGKVQGERRWEQTLALVQSGKTISDVAKIRGRTEGTILKHLESLRAEGLLSVQEIVHLAQGSEEAIANIHNAFRELGANRLSPVFQKLGGVHSYEMLRIARLLFNEKFPQGDCE